MIRVNGNPRWMVALLFLLFLLLVHQSFAAQPSQGTLATRLDVLQKKLSLVVLAQLDNADASELAAQSLRHQGLMLWATAPNAEGRGQVLDQLQQWGLLANLPGWDPQVALPQLTPVDLPPPPDKQRIESSIDFDKLSQPLVVHFWAQWCGPCRRELPELATFYAEQYLALQLAGLALITVNNDPTFDRASLHKLAGPTAQLPVLHDPNFRLYRRLAQTHDVALPATFLLQPGLPSQVLAYGPMEWLVPGITQDLKALLGQR